MCLRVRIKNFILLFHHFPGPSTWIDKFPAARGERQSPVDITTSTTSGAQLPPLKWNYSPAHTRSLVNPGYCWKVEENGKDSGEWNDKQEAKIIVETGSWDALPLVLYLKFDRVLRIFDFFSYNLFLYECLCENTCLKNWSRQLFLRWTTKEGLKLERSFK